MTSLALIRARDAEAHKFTNLLPCHKDVRALLALVDELQRDRLQSPDKLLDDGIIASLRTELVTLRAALLEAGPAIEAGAALCIQRVLVTAQLTPVSETKAWSDHAAKLRALMGLVK